MDFIKIVGRKGEKRGMKKIKIKNARFDHFQRLLMNASSRLWWKLILMIRGLNNLWSQGFFLDRRGFYVGVF